MKQLGQYFTVSDELQQFVFDKVKNKGDVLLEPSFGAGHLLQKFKEYDRNYPIVCYEIDSGIKPVVEFNEHQKTEYADFTKQKITTKFKSIVGNPPYVKQKTGNVCQFSWYCEVAARKKLLTISNNALYNDITDLALRFYLYTNEFDDPTKGALFFHADYVKPTWNNMKRTAYIGRHIFYNRVKQRNI
jgi:hypothetical protein